MINKEEQLRIIANKFNGHLSSDMQEFFSKELHPEIYNSLIDIKNNNLDYDYLETRVFDSIASSINTPQEYLNKFYEVLTTQNNYLKLFEKRTYYSEKPLKDQKKLANDYIRIYKSSFAKNNNISKELFDTLKEERNHSIIKNETHFTNEDIFIYLKGLDKISKKDYKTILGLLSSRENKNEQIVDFIFKNASYGDISYMIHFSNNIKDLEDCILDNIISATTINLTTKERLIKDFLLILKDIISETSLKKIKEEFPKLYAKHFPEEKKKERKPKFNFQ